MILLMVDGPASGGTIIDPQNRLKPETVLNIAIPGAVRIGPPTEPWAEPHEVHTYHPITVRFPGGTPVLAQASGLVLLSSRREIYQMLPGELPGWVFDRVRDVELTVEPDRRLRTWLEESQSLRLSDMEWDLVCRAARRGHRETLFGAIRTARDTAARMRAGTHSGLDWQVLGYTSEDGIPEGDRPRRFAAGSGRFVGPVFRSAAAAQYRTALLRYANAERWEDVSPSLLGFSDVQFSDPEGVGYIQPGPPPHDWLGAGWTTDGTLESRIDAVLTYHEQETTDAL